MKKISCFAVCVFLSFLWLPLASAAPEQSQVAQKPKQVQDSTQNGQVIQPKAGISWKEKVLKQRDIKKRGEARRNALTQQAEKNSPKTPQNVPPPAMNP